MITPILTTKLYIPSSRAELVARPRLTERLDQSLAQTPSISLICAPPGFGKTTLLSEWINQTVDQPQAAYVGHDSEAGASMHNISLSPRSSTAVAWVSLDEQDNDPARFLSYMVAALEKVQPGLGPNTKALVQAPQSSTPEEILTTLINEIMAISEPFTLVFDDYHLIERGLIHEAMTFFLDHLPPQMHLIIISRTDPPFPLTRFRVRNQLTEIRDSDLRFTPTEAATFLNQVMGLQLSPNDILALEARTEGWIAGLQLAALSMQGRGDTPGFVQAFTGSHRYVLDYLAEEVLSRQPDDLREFLLKTSILKRLHGPLCDAVIGDLNGSSASRYQSQAILEQIEQSHLFIIPLDDERRWYRYHHLFADVLRENLQKAATEDEIFTLHQRAATWYAEQGFTAEAIGHALAAQDFERCVALIEPLSLDLLVRGEATTLLDWLDKLPQQVVRTRPRLSLSSAWANMILSREEEVVRATRDAEQALSALEKQANPQVDGAETNLQEMRGEVTAIQAVILAEEGRIEEAIDLTEKALTQLPLRYHLGRSVLLNSLGGGYALTGEFAKAIEVFSEALDIAKKSDNLIIVLTASNSLAELEVAHGHLSAAVTIYQETRAFIEAYNLGQGLPGHPSFLAARTYLGMAEILREQNDLEAASEQLNIGLDLARQGSNVMGAHHISQIILARLLQAQGDLSAAQEAIQVAEEMITDRSRSLVSQWQLAVQARLWLAAGNLAAAVHWAETCDLPLDEDNFDYSQFPGEYTTLVRVYLAQEKFAEAQMLLDRMQAEEERLSRQARLLELLIVRALLHYAQGEAEQALPPLKQALPIAEAGQFVRIFLDEGPAMKTLLTVLNRQPAMAGHPYLTHLLTAFASEPDAQSAPPSQNPKPVLSKVEGSKIQNLIEPLSDRELEVLSLIADGLSNQEIADTLIIAEGTVKKHIHNIFGKLDVRRRTQVVVRARELGLL